MVKGCYSVMSAGIAWSVAHISELWLRGFTAAFCHRHFWIPVRHLELCFGVTSEQEKSLSGQTCSSTWAEQWHCCSTSCLPAGAELCGHSGEINIETEFCTAHKTATLRLLKCFCLILSHCKAQIPHTVFWQMLFGILSQDWCVQVEIFILFYFVRLCVVVSNEKFLTTSALDFQIWWW